MKIKCLCIAVMISSVLISCSKEDTQQEGTTKANIAAEEIVASVNTEPVRPNVASIDKFLPNNHSEERTKDITHLIIHFISNASVNPKDPYNVNDVYSIFEDSGLSVHYMIDRSGQIYQLVSEDRIAYHAGKGSLPDFPEYENKMNEYSLGIELLAVGTKEEMTGILPDNTYDLINPSLAGYTDAQYQSLQLLVKDILKRNPAIQGDRQHVIGHNEYATGRKTDPGSLFDWTKIGF